MISPPLTGSFQAAPRITGHVLENRGISLGGLHTLDIAAGELVDQRNIHAADEANLAGLGGHGGQHADKIGTFLLLEDDGLHVRQVDNHVNDGKLQVGIFLGDFFQGRGLGKACRDDRAVALVGKIADRLFALGFIGDFEFAIGDARSQP